MTRHDHDRPPTQPELLLGGGPYPIELLAAAADTEGRATVIRWHVPADKGPKLHTHAWEDESIYLLEGRLDVALGDEVRVLLPGEFVMLPRGIPHRFVAVEPSTLLTTFSPGGFDDFLRERDRLFRRRGELDDETVDRLRCEHRTRMAARATSLRVPT